MDQAQAKQALEPLWDRMGAKYLRARTLIDHPDELNQGNCNLCAMSCVVRSLLQHDLAKFVDLVKAVYFGTDFGPARLSAIPLLDALSPMSAEMMQTQRAFDRFELDFLLSRAVGVLLELTDHAEYRRQLEHGRGHLALDTTGMLALLRKVVRMPVADLSYHEPELAVKQVNDALADPRPFVYAGTYGYAELCRGSAGASARTFDAGPTAEQTMCGMAAPEIAHWVAVTGPIGQTATHYTVPVWTWSSTFVVTVRRDLLGRYFPRYVLGRVR